MSTYEARTIFRELGAGEVRAQLATQWAFHKPITSQPGAAGSESAIGLIQRGLQSLGCAVKTDGKLDPLTAQCLLDLSGPNWKNMTWLEHGKAILSLRKQGKKIPQNTVPFEGLGAASFGGSAGGLLIILGAAFVFYKFSKK